MANMKNGKLRALCAAALAAGGAAAGTMVHNRPSSFYRTC